VGSGSLYIYIYTEQFYFEEILQNNIDIYMSIDDTYMSLISKV
jgi:hypothetical protein